MINITFTGSAHEVLNDMRLFVDRKDTGVKTADTKVVEADKVVETEEVKKPRKRTKKVEEDKPVAAAEPIKTEEPTKQTSKSVKNTEEKVAEPVKAEEPTELTDEQKVELRNKTVAFCQKNAANKVKIKEFMKEVGVEQLTHIKPSDLPKFNAMVGE